MTSEKFTYLDKIIHEMNSPLQAIYMLSDIMLNDKNYISTLDKDIRENIEHIYGSSTKLIKIVGLLSSVTNLKANKVTLQLEELDLIQLVKYEVKRQQFCSKSNSGLKIVLNNKVQNFRAKVDGFWLEQLLANLILNAINHSEKGIIEIVTDFLTKENCNYFFLSVSDEGCGIPTEELESIFLPLERGTHSIGKTQGSGIGLAIAREVAEAHNGTITAHNNEKGGAVFVVLLPLLK